MLPNAVGGGSLGGCQISLKKVLRRSTVQRHECFEGVGGVEFPEKTISNT